VGVELATADFGGWDHHEFLPNAFFGQAQNWAMRSTASWMTSANTRTASPW